MAHSKPQIYVNYEYYVYYLYLKLQFPCPDSENQV